MENPRNKKPEKRLGRLYSGGPGRGVPINRRTMLRGGHGGHSESLSGIWTQDEYDKLFKKGKYAEDKKTDDKRS